MKNEALGRADASSPSTLQKDRCCNYVYKLCAAPARAMVKATTICRNPSQRWTTCRFVFCSSCCSKPEKIYVYVISASGQCGLPASAGAPRHLVSLNDSGSSVQVPLQAFNKCIFAFQTGCVLRGRLDRKGFLYFPILFNGCLVKTRWWNCTGDMQRSHWLPFAPFPGPQLVQYQRPLLSRMACARMACARMAASVTKCDSRRNGEMTSGSRNECESVRRVSERNILS